jgi:hypothetical protein
MERASKQKRGPYVAPSVSVLTEKEVLEVFQITTAGMSSWWMM